MSQHDHNSSSKESISVILDRKFKSLCPVFSFFFFHPCSNIIRLFGDRFQVGRVNYKITHSQLQLLVFPTIINL